MWYIKKYSVLYWLTASSSAIATLAIHSSKTFSRKKVRIFYRTRNRLSCTYEHTTPGLMTRTTIAPRHAIETSDASSQPGWVQFPTTKTFSYLSFKFKNKENSYLHKILLIKNALPEYNNYDDKSNLFVQKTIKIVR